MQASILEICVGMPREITVNGKTVLSGIFKSPVQGAVRLTLTHLAGDGQADPRFHGGREKAVYVYSAVHYAWWQDNWQRPEGQAVSLEPSPFGQNLTVDGLPDHEVRIGDRFRLGSAVVTVAQPRIPCAKLGVRVNDPGFANRFLQAGLLGYYLYVDEPGWLGQGDAMRLIRQSRHGITVRDLWQTVFTRKHDPELARAALQLPHLDRGWKQRLQKITENP